MLREYLQSTDFKKILQAPEPDKLLGKLKRFWSGYSGQTS